MVIETAYAASRLNLTFGRFFGRLLNSIELSPWMSLPEVLLQSCQVHHSRGAHWTSRRLQLLLLFLGGPVLLRLGLLGVV